MSLRMHGKFLTSATIVALAASGCAGGQGSVPPAPGSTTVMQTVRAPGVSPAKGGGKSILAQLKNQVVIGSTIDSVYGQLNPYGLDVAKSTNGAFTKGDLAVCNFNDDTNTQGTGYTIVALHPIPGSSPALVAADPTTLTGCDALALGPDDTMYAAAFSSNDNPVFSSSGMLETNLSGPPFNHPFGQIYAEPKHGENGQGQNGQDDQNGQGNENGQGNKHATAAVYESNAGDGSIVRIDPKSLQSEVIATGFPINGGPPGSILGPSGLQYDSQHDTLFVVDGENNSVTELSKVSSLHAGCLKIRSNGTQFDGPCKSHAKVLFSGPPLNGPISSALLFNGSLVIGNTLDATGENLMIEISHNGKLLDVRNVDTGPGGSLFGMVATGTNAANTKLYFNDDNDNNLQVLEH